MAAFDFPASPAVGDIYTPAGADVSYKWSGAVWLAQPNGSIQPLSMKVTSYTAPGTIPYAKPPNLKFLEVQLWGAGGGGGGAGTSGAATVSAGGGGGAGGYCVKLYRADELDAIENLVLGAGGNGAGTTNDGVDGGNSTFKGMLASGGNAGTGGTASASGFTGRGGPGGSSGGDFNGSGNSGQPGIRAPNGVAAQAQAGLGGAAFGRPQYFSTPTTGQSNFTGTQAGNATGGNGNANGFSQSYTGLGQKGGDGMAILTEYYVDGDTVEGSSFVNMRRVVATASGNYVPPAGLKFVDVELVGTGGNGGLAAATGASQSSAGSGGGGAGYCRKLYAAADLAASEPYVIGAQGAGSGDPGGASTFKGMTAGGGAGGGTIAASTSVGQAATAAGGTATGGDINIPGGSGTSGGRNAVQPGSPSPGMGGASFLTAARSPRTWYLVTTTGPFADDGLPYGSGGEGAGNGASQASGASGGKGAKGVIIFTEYY